MPEVCTLLIGKLCVRPDRAKKCPYSLLLEHHCPLPPGVARLLCGRPQMVERR